MDKQLKRYYKQRQYGGRSTAARALDGVALRLIFAVACYLWYQSNVKNQLISLALTGVTMLLLIIALHLYRGLSFDKFVAKEQLRLKGVVLRERLLLLREADFLALCTYAVGERPDADNAWLWCSQRAAALDEDAVLTAFYAAQDHDAKELILCALSPCTIKAAALIKRLPIPTVFITPDQILKKAAEMDTHSITSEDVDAYIRGEQTMRDARRKRMQTQPFALGRAKKYLICAVVLFVASFVTGYALYYRLLAGLCLTLAGTTFLINRPAQQKVQEQT